MSQRCLPGGNSGGKGESDNEECQKEGTGSDPIDLLRR